MRIAALTGFALALMAAPAWAQGVNPFGIHSSDDLTAEDRRLAEEASHRLYAGSDPSIGASRAWSNAASGNAGTVTLVRMHDYQGMPCLTLEHRLSIKGYARPVVFHIDRCRTKTGEWKIL